MIRIIGKIGFLLVIIGFFMPIACDQNGFKIAEYMVKNDAVIDGALLYLMFAVAVIGIILAALLLIGKRAGTGIDWILVIACIASGFIVYIKQFKDGPDLQNGAYVILAGWIVALVFQILSAMKRER